MVRAVILQAKTIVSLKQGTTGAMIATSSACISGHVTVYPRYRAPFTPPKWNHRVSWTSETQALTMQMNSLHFRHQRKRWSKGREGSFGQEKRTRRKVRK